MTPLINTSGMAEALRVYQRLVSYSAPAAGNATCRAFTPQFLDGTCALTLDFDTMQAWDEGTEGICWDAFTKDA